MMVVVVAIFLLTELAADPGLSPAVRATVWIRAGARSVGTGWIVDKERRWVVTARHVVADRENVDIYFHSYRDGESVAERDYYLKNQAPLRAQGRVLTGRVVRRNDAADLALIEVDTLPADACALRLATTPPAAGDSCWSIGHRHDSDILWLRTRGHIRQSGTLSTGYFWAGQRLGRNVPVLFAQLPTEAGESGSALLNSSGHVAGVVSAVSQRTSQLVIASAWTELVKFLRAAQKDTTSKDAEHRTDPPRNVAAVVHSTVWVQPRSTDGRFAGVLIDRARGLILTSASAVAAERIVDVVAPKFDGKQAIAELEHYRDLLGLRLAGHCVQGVVLSCDAVRDLALIELERIPEALVALPQATSVRAGETVVSMSHPVGEELLWLFAAGSVRQTGRIPLRRDEGKEGQRPLASLLQLPHQGSDSGGPVVNDRGELVGVLATRAAARQELAYAAAPAEIRAFLTSAQALWQPMTAAQWVARGQLLARLNRAKPALQAFQQAERLAPADCYVRACHARALAEAGHGKESTALLSRLAQLAERSGECEIEMAAAYLALGQHRKADDAVGAGMRSSPRQASALVIRSRLREGDAARADVAAALEIDPAYGPAYLRRAELHDVKDSEAQQKAIADLSRAIELHPEDVTARRRRAATFATILEHKRSLADWLRVVEIEPLAVDNWFGLAEAQFRTGARAAAAGSIAAAVRVDARQLRPALGMLRAFAQRLRDDNAADLERVSDWFTIALTELAPWLPPTPRTAIEDALQVAKTQDERGRIATLEKAIANLMGK